MLGASIKNSSTVDSTILSNPSTSTSIRPAASPASGFCKTLAVAALLIAAVLLFPLKAVMVKMLPFDNKSEFQIVIDMPEGSTLEQTAAVAGEIGEFIGGVPEVTDYQTYKAAEKLSVHLVR